VTRRREEEKHKSAVCNIKVSNKLQALGTRQDLDEDRAERRERERVCKAWEG
jgi:hypothetical protein